MTRVSLPAPRPPTPGWWAQPWWMESMPVWWAQPVPPVNAVLILRGVGFIVVTAQAMLLVALGYDVGVVTAITAAAAAAAAGLTSGLLGQRAQ